MGPFTGMNRYSRATWKKRVSAKAWKYWNKPKKSLSTARSQNLSKNIFWFKKAGDIKASPTGEIYLQITPGEVFQCPAFVNMCRNYEQYKVLRVIAKYYIAYGGSESTTQLATGYKRGNVVTWIDQPPLQTQPLAGGITTIMGFPSAKLHQSNRTIKRWMSRPSGGHVSDWNYITHPTALGLPVIENDDWTSVIKIFGDNFGVPGGTGINKPYFFVEYTYKVIFRSKWRGGPIPA